jgi:hypothetical protein
MVDHGHSDDARACHWFLRAARDGIAVSTQYIIKPRYRLHTCLVISGPCPDLLLDRRGVVELELQPGLPRRTPSIACSVSRLGQAASDRLCEKTPSDLRQSLAPRCRSQTALQCVVQCVPTSKLQQPFDTF